MDPPTPEPLVRYAIFPVCLTGLARDSAKPIRSLADLSTHVMLDFDTLLYGRPWSDWEQWLETMNMRTFKPAGSLRFGHYDQAIQAAIGGGGIAIGKWPHVMRELRSGVLCAPLGNASIAWRGGYHPVVRTDVESEVVGAFLDWLRSEVRSDGELDVESRPAAGAKRRRAS